MCFKESNSSIKKDNLYFLNNYKLVMAVYQPCFVQFKMKLIRKFLFPKSKTNFNSYDECIYIVQQNEQIFKINVTW